MNHKLFWWKEKNNFGDMLSPWIYEKITGAPPSWTQESPKLLTLGSILHFAEEGDVLWGTGILKPGKIPKNLTVKAVRGQLTAQDLANRDIEVPDVYGDPALLLPRFYTPTGHDHEIGVFPHFRDENLSNWARTQLQTDSPKLLDRIHTYHLLTNEPQIDDPKRRDSHVKMWIDCICKYPHVITSSLHVLIIREAYGLPVTLVECEQPKYKYIDYFASTNREYLAVKLTDKIPEPISITPRFPDLDKLLAAFPHDNNK